MTRDELLTKLRELKPWLEEQGIVNVRLFGSYARDDARPDSDVDLIVELSKPLGFRFLNESWPKDSACQSKWGPRTRCTAL